MIKEFDKYNKLNEYFNSEYRYENIIIKINDMEELDEIKEYLKKRIYSFLFDKDQIYWDVIFKNVEYSVKNRPSYIRIDNQNDKYTLHFGDMTNYDRNDYEYENEKLFTINDVRNDFLMNIFKYGISTLPSYKPRKIDRSLNESFNDYKYDNIFIELNSVDDVDQIKKYINKVISEFKLTPNIGYNKFINRIKVVIEDDNEPQYIRLDLKYYPCIDFGYSSVKYFRENYQSFALLFEKLFTMEDVRNNLLGDILKYGKYIPKPSYNPRKIDRSLNESLLSYAYHDIYIQFDSMYEVDQFGEYIDKIMSQFKLKTDCSYKEMIESVIYYINNDNKPYYIRINLDNYPSIKFGYSSIEFFNRLCRDSYFTNSFERLFTIKDIKNNFLEDIIKYGSYSFKPIYKPRKIDKNI